MQQTPKRYYILKSDDQPVVRAVPVAHPCPTAAAPAAAVGVPSGGEAGAPRARLGQSLRRAPESDRR